MSTLTAAAHRPAPVSTFPTTGTCLIPAVSPAASGARPQEAVR